MRRCPLFSAAMSFASISLWSTAWDRVLPIPAALWETCGPRYRERGPMSRVRQLERCFRKRVRELLRVLWKRREIFSRRVELECEVRRQHPGDFLDASWACGTVPLPALLFGFHCFAPAGLW